jgi:hypothetical protein
MTLAGKIFRAVANSSNGTIGTDTTMTFVSDDERGLLGVYAGGTIRIGQVVARRRDHCTVEMLHQCVTVSQELKAGRALAHFSHAPDKTLSMHLDWQWLTGDQSEASLNGDSRPLEGGASVNRLTMAGSGRLLARR